MRLPVRRHGFTLIEILVVLVIMGLMAGAMVMIGSDNREAIARDEIEQLHAKLKIALEEAQLYGVEYGLVVGETDYQFVSFEDERWTPISDDPAYRRHRLPDGFELALEIEGFKLPGARLPGARITEDGEVVVDETADDDKSLLGNDRKSEAASGDQTGADSNAKTEPAADTATNASSNNEDDDAPKLLPQVFLLSSGELNPFVLAIGNREQNPVFYRLRATVDGDLKMEGPIRADPVDDLTIEWENPDPEAESEPESDDDLIGRERDRLLDDERKPRERKPAAGGRDGGK